MLALFRTLFDIIRIRKGPDAIPYSWLLMLLVLTLWLIVGLVMNTMAEDTSSEAFLLSTLVGVVGLGCYASMVVAAGHAPRLLQTMTAIVGCGALLGLLFIVGTTVLPKFLPANTVNFVMTILLLWSIPVEGHIISRSIDRRWFVGLVAAMAVFVFQLLVYALLSPPTRAVTDTVT